MLRALSALLIAGVVLLGSAIFYVDTGSLAQAQPKAEDGLPPPKTPWCKDCWAQYLAYADAWNELRDMERTYDRNAVRISAFSNQMLKQNVSEDAKDEYAKLLNEQDALAKSMVTKKAELEQLRKKLDTCNARKCFQDKLAIPDIPPEEIVEPCAACRDIAGQYEYVKAKLERMRIMRDQLITASTEADNAATAAAADIGPAVQAAKADPGDKFKDNAAEAAKKETTALKERAAQLRAQLAAIRQAFGDAVNVMKKLEAELANCRKKNCPPPTTQVSTPVPPPDAYEPPLRPCPRCQDEAGKLAQLERDLRVKQRLRLTMQTAIDDYGKDIDKGTLTPVNQMTVNEAVERLPEVLKQIAELEAKVKAQKDVMAKCTEKFCSTSQTTGRKKDKVTTKTGRLKEKGKIEESKTNNETGTLQIPVIIPRLGEGRNRDTFRNTKGGDKGGTLRREEGGRKGGGGIGIDVFPGSGITFGR